DTAVEQEEIEYFATGHPLVEALFGFLRDGPYGRNGFRFFARRGPARPRGIEFLFHANPPEPEDTSPGARVPSRQLSRYHSRRPPLVARTPGPTGRQKRRAAHRRAQALRSADPGAGRNQARARLGLWLRRQSLTRPPVPTAAEFARLTYACGARGFFS